jgi:hypothetical protein
MHYIGEGKGKWEVFPVHDMKAYTGRTVIAPLILSLGSRWKCITLPSGRFTTGDEPPYVTHFSFFLV